MLLDGYDADCSPKRAQLLAGQRQPVEIARARVRKSRLLVDKTSALKVASEKPLQEDLERVARGVTIIDIVHRQTSSLWSKRARRRPKAGTRSLLRRARAIVSTICSRCSAIDGTADRRFQTHGVCIYEVECVIKMGVLYGIVS